MAYNYPYQPQFYTVNPQIMSPTQMPGMSNNFQNGTSSIIWVQGEAGAKSYLVAPNTTVQLWDSEAQTIYLKSADASGMPSMKTIDYTVRERVQGDLSHENASKVEFVTRQEFNALEAEIQSLKAMLRKEASQNEYNADVDTDKK